MAKISLIVNGNPVNANVDPRTLLVQFLRENLRLTGTHVGCDTSQCGACVVHLDGKAVKSCTTLAVMADGHEVRTIEGLAADGAPLHPMQEAFREHHGLQCGFCTPGMIMTAVDIVHRKGHDLSDHTIREELEGNLCRCTGYQNIVQSIAAGAKAMANSDLALPISAHGDQEYFMYEFKYHRPATVRQAANLLVKNEDAKVIAGGHTLLPVMKQRLASPPHLVDLSHIEGLDGIEMKGRSLVIGATATHHAVATSAVVGEAIPALAELAGLIGDPAVRHKGTIGGSLANNDPTADYPAACLALGATIVTNKRRLKPEEFFQGLFTTSLESDEIITRVMFPVPKKAAYVKFRNQASRYALVGVFVAKRPSDVRVAVTGAGSEGVFRVTSFEEALKKRFSPKALDGLTVPAEGLNSDLHGSAEYRAHLIAVLARRAVEAATAKA